VLHVPDALIKGLVVLTTFINKFIPYQLL
jgi:hypothetical protein